MSVHQVNGLCSAHPSHYMSYRNWLLVEQVPHVRLARGPLDFKFEARLSIFLLQPITNVCNMQKKTISSPLSKSTPKTYTGGVASSSTEARESNPLNHVLKQCLCS